MKAILGSRCGFWTSLFVVFAGSASQLGAASKTWTAAVSGNFSGPGNWNPAGVPSVSDAVFLNFTTTTPCNVDTNALISAASMSAGTLSVMAGRTFTTSLGFSFSGSAGNSLLQIASSATLNIGQNFTTGAGTNTTDFIFSSSGVGLVTIGQTLDLSGTSDVLTLDGTAYSGGTASLLLFRYSGSLTGMFDTVNQIAITGNVVYDTLNKQVRFDVVPEPSAIALLNLPAGLLVANGRRRRAPVRDTAPSI